jgi:acetyl-CoA C-acetyltransferase
MDAIAVAARSVKSGEADIVVAGGVESMSRAPFVMPKAEGPFSRVNAIHDTTIGWRFVNPRMKAAFGVDSMPETAENVADEFGINREDQDRFALESQRRARAAQDGGRFDCEIVPVAVSKKGGDPQIIARDEHLRSTTLEALAALKPIVRPGGTVTAGNASGVNDGAAAMIIASEAAVARYGLTPRARFVGGAVVGVPPRIMGIAPAPATRRLLLRQHLGIADIDVVELNEAFASQGLAVLRELGLPDQAEHVNRNGGAIALGHPLGMSGVRLAMTAVEELARTQSKRALCTMCIGVGQGIATLFERV